MHLSDGTEVEYKISEVDSISFTSKSTPVVPPAPEVVEKVLTFEDADAAFSPFELDYCGVTVNTWSDLIPGEDEQAYGRSPLIYDIVNGYNNPQAKYTWTDEGNTFLTHTFPYSWGGYHLAGGGIALSKHSITFEKLEEIYENWGDVYDYQLSIVSDTEDNGNFAIAYIESSKNDDDVKPVISFSDGKARVIKEMQVRLTAPTLYCMLYGNAFSDAYDSDDYLKLTVKGTAADGTVKTVETYLAQADDYTTWAFEWTTFDLSSLGEVVSIQLFMDEAQFDDYGYAQYYRTPVYVALDNIVVLN